jgi:hypothetical protein
MTISNKKRSTFLPAKIEVEPNKLAGGQFLMRILRINYVK